MEFTARIIADARRCGVTPVIVLLAALWTSLVAAWEWLVPHDPAITLCFFKRWTGWPCPTCGSTRSIKALLHGDLGGALANNPLLVISITAIAFWLVARWAFRVQRTDVLALRTSQVLPGAIIVGLALNWLYLLAREAAFSR